MVIKNKLTIPDIRKRLREIANEIEHNGLHETAHQIHDLVNQMYREQYKKERAPCKSQTCTPQLQKEIREYAHKNQKLSNQEIANFFHVNPGRVSEALKGD